MVEKTLTTPKTTSNHKPPGFTLEDFPEHWGLDGSKFREIAVNYANARLAEIVAPLVEERDEARRLAEHFKEQFEFSSNRERVFREENARLKLKLRNALLDAKDVLDQMVKGFRDGIATVPHSYAAERAERAQARLETVLEFQGEKG